MSVEQMKEILKKEYGINSYEELNAAIENSTGLNIGIFTKGDYRR